MSGAKATVVEPGAGPEYNVLGEMVTVKVHGRETGGAFSQVEVTCGPQSGPPPHLHFREEETFYVLEGEFEFLFGEEVIRGGAGTVVSLPRGVAHRFGNVGTVRGKMLVTMTPAGFEGFFERVGALTPEEQQDIPRILEIGKSYGLEFLPPA
jgi:quercetin dioxygenase-like cupin family protein